jgi:hypothetical protein
MKEDVVFGLFGKNIHEDTGAVVAAVVIAWRVLRAGDRVKKVNKKKTHSMLGQLNPSKHSWTLLI